MSNCAAICEWFEEVWNKRDISTITRMMAADVVVHSLSEGGSDLRGHDAFLQFHRALTSAFPDLRVHVEDTIELQDKVALRFSAVGTHTGQGAGFPPPTNRAVKIHGMTIARLEHGKFVEGWDLFDALGMLQQIGVAPKRGG